MAQEIYATHDPYNNWRAIFPSRQAYQQALNEYGDYTANGGTASFGAWLRDIHWGSAGGVSLGGDASGGQRPPGLSEVEASNVLTGMREGGHAIRHLQGVLIPNTGSLESRVEAFRLVVTPVLENLQHVSNWQVGGTQGRAYLGMVDGQNIVVVVALDGPFQGKVITAFIPDANQLAILNSR
jgi:hypothetical protein